MEERFPGVFVIEGKIATQSFAPGTKVYGERVKKIDNTEYRLWEPYRSKLSAAILKGIKNMPIKPGNRVLYLGAASGTTASHVSDLVGEKGLVYCVEFAPRPVRDLIAVCEARPNMLPILADARKTESYAKDVGKVDVVYCDIADPQEIAIFIDNCTQFLKPKGWGLIAVKSRSIDVTKQPREVYQAAGRQLEKNFSVEDFVMLEPFEKDHCFFVVRVK